MLRKVAVVILLVAVAACSSPFGPVSDHEPDGGSEYTAQHEPDGGS